jgi:hypothetical protein
MGRLGFGVVTPRERREAELFFAELMGLGTHPPAPAVRESFGEQPAPGVARSSIVNPGDVS